jgi:zinc D-Ala-D-Ala carboxypeptidase
MVGRPLPIVSGYRCPVHNAAVGGARDSMHMYGAAVDIPLGLVTPLQATRAGFVGIGTQRGSVRHIDVRDGAAARWTY